MDRIRHPQKLGDRYALPDDCEATFVVLHDGWVDDLERLHASLRSHCAGAWRMVVVDNPVDDEASGRIAGLAGVEHIPLRDHVGFAAGRNLGLRLATGRMVVIVDTSVEATGDIVGALAARLNAPDVGLVGRWGVVTRDGFDFTHSDGPDVDGVEAYLMAMPRALAARIGGFHPKFRWYRNADLDLSFRVRDAGLRTIVDPSLPVRRHVHRLWETTPVTEREESSRRNFFRFRDHWGSRGDLFTLGPPATH